MTLIGKDGIFNTTRVSKEEYDVYIHRGFVQEKDKFIVEKILYKIAFVVFSIFSIVSLIFFYKLRKSYIIRQRNFCLTFTGGILTYLNTFFGFIPQMSKIPCILSVFSSNILNVAVNFIFLTRSLRVILFYYFNTFKVSSIKKKNTNREPVGVVEPNSYLPKIYRRVNKIIAAFIIGPVAISFFVTIIIYLLSENARKGCPIFESNDALIELKNNHGKELFSVVVVFGVIITILNAICSVLLLYVKDANKYGVKFECLSVCILVLVISIINILLQANASDNASISQNTDEKFNNNKGPRRVLLDIFEKTKGGKMLFNFVSIYMIFVSITLPVIHYYRAKSIKNNYIEDPITSIQCFYKVLKTPSLVNELRDIAIKEFSVENVLFWENYQLLQKMVYRYQVQSKKAKELGDDKIVSQYNFDEYYQQQVQSFSTSSMDEYSYDPTMPVPKEILPYYTSFYHMFIDFNGIAVVNILGDTVKRIFNDICSYPTVGMYDTARNEVVEMMYSSIYPILLEKHKEDIINTLG
ncbi:hypothetical protein BCR32DRAFT_240036 [Anaeromyces robustus]|uniref:RGS domain-containing protein n=1 Tax=Anaeromyces robustus TaxID=1754192 RepID=A0A1Y1XP86_9FUNG|nr:hypothetical protein BCR32DRAFT_240036 [Anaeromyces robustus]|eukprot:ORX87559.1 hypothetical protein BCR32DRAFT_240036 [Anaeromyces robustus]